MLLKDLFPEVLDNIEITGIATDSRFVEPGFLFIPKVGSNFSGSEFYLEAIQKGAVAVVSTYPINNMPVDVVVVNNIDEVIVPTLQKFYGKPFDNAILIGVTGTDGKTTITTIVSHLLENIAPSCYIGTNGIFSSVEELPSIFTTPILSENYRLIRKFVDEGHQYISMEVSSQGIANDRIKSLLYDYAVFSNLSHEHLDTHKTMKNYFNTKMQLFKQLKPHGIGIVNKDDGYAKFFESLDNIIYYSIFTPSDYQAINIRYFKDYTMFDLLTKDCIYENIKINRCEEYNIYNILPTIIIALHEGINIHDLYMSLSNLPIVPGRLEKVITPFPFNIYVDFAHTPGALEAVLSSLKMTTTNRLILVCGAAGKKDKTKRPLMGKIACKYADLVIFTSEDPRSENPDDIIKQLTSRINTDNYKCITNRKDAINYALRWAKAGDTIIVTGKGRETFYEENNVIYQYSDFDYILNHPYI